MKRVVCGILAVLLVLLMPAAAEGLTVVQNGEHMQISGKLSEGGKLVSVTVYAPSGKISSMEVCESDGDGSFSFLYPLADSESGTYTVTASAKGEPEQKGTFSYQVKSGNKILSFHINGMPGVFSGNRITVTVDRSADRSHMKPHFSLSEKAVATVAGVEQVSGVSEQDFTRPVTYTVTAQSGAAAVYTVEVVYKSASGGGGSSGSGNGNNNNQVIASEPVATPTQAPGPNRVEFRDLDGFDWARPYILELAKKEIVNGVGEGLFLPQKKVTREEFVKMVMEAFSFDSTYEKTAFADVEQGAWYAGYVAGASRLGIISGVAPDRFGVGTSITRQDMAVIAWNAAQKAGITLQEVEKEIEFSDSAQIAPYARQAVSAMQRAGILSGMEEGRFGPTEKANRAQSCKIIAKLLEG